MTAINHNTASEAALHSEIQQMEASLARSFSAGTLSSGPRVYQHHARLLRQARHRLYLRQQPVRPAQMMGEAPTDFLV